MMKKLFAFFTAALFLVMSLNINALTAKAAAPKTYYVKYNADKKDWYYQPGNKWSEEIVARELYYMTLEFKDGDYVVVEGHDDFPELELDFHLGNFTLITETACTVKAKSIKDCYVLIGATTSITAPVENGYVYDRAKANFNSDCYNLELVYDAEPTMAVNVIGKCNYFFCHNNTDTKYMLWDFTEQLTFADGYLQTPYWSYKIEAPAGGVQTPSLAPTQTPTTKPSTPAQGVLDDVPKTGQSYNYIVALAAAVLCLAGCYSLKKKF